MFTANDTPELVAQARVLEEIPPGGPLPTLGKEDPKPNDVALVGDSTTLIEDGSIEDGSNQLWCEAWDVCTACCQSGFIFGVEATFLAPLGEPQQTVILTDLNKEQAYAGSSDPGLGAGVRTWLGLQRDGWGFRFQYWHFGNEAIHVNPAVPMGAQPAFEEVFYLNADTIDIELTQGMCFGASRIHSSLGVRYARLQRNSTVVGYGTVGDGVDLYGLAMGANEIEGSGFTFSVGGRKPLGCSGGWHTFWSYRGSLLWAADSTASVLTEANAVTKSPVAIAHSRDKAFTCNDSEDVFISEFQWGVQYERCLCCLPATLFFRFGLEYHHWNTGGVFAQSNSFAFLQGGPPEFGGRVDAVANAHDGDLDLIGFVFGGGLTY